MIVSASQKILWKEARLHLSIVAMACAIQKDARDYLALEFFE